MKKFVAIVLALTLMLACVACSSTMTSAQFKEEYQKFDWDGATNNAAQAEAERLIVELEKMPTAMQTELSDIREELEMHADGMMTPDDGVLPEEMLPENMLPDGEMGEEITNPDSAENSDMPEIEMNNQLRRKITAEKAPVIGKKNKTELPEESQAPSQRHHRHPKMENGERAPLENGEVPNGEKPDGERRPRSERPHGERPDGTHQRPENGKKAQLPKSEEEIAKSAKNA